MHALYLTLFKCRVAAILTILYFRYKQKDIGLTAFNDSILLETCVYTALKQYFADKDYYMVNITS